MLPHRIAESRRSEVFHVPMPNFSCASREPCVRTKRPCTLLTQASHAQLPRFWLVPHCVEPHEISGSWSSYRRFVIVNAGQPKPLIAFSVHANARNAKTVIAADFTHISVLRQAGAKPALVPTTVRGWEPGGIAWSPQPDGGRLPGARVFCARMCNPLENVAKSWL